VLLQNTNRVLKTETLFVFSNGLTTVTDLELAIFFQNHNENDFMERYVSAF